MSVTWAERWRARKKALSLGALAVPLPDPWPCGRTSLCCTIPSSLPPRSPHKKTVHQGPLFEMPGFPSIKIMQLL